jgi:hypothetical protein
LPVWKANPEGNYQSVVDSNKLFDFVELLKDTENVWIVGFEVAQDICNTLLQQLAYLFMDSGMPLRLVIDRTAYWEFRLFCFSPLI